LRSVRTVRTIVLTLIVLLLPGVAFAMPRGDEKKKPDSFTLTPEDEEILRTRERMKEQYLKDREERRKALEAAVAEASGARAKGGVPGWRNQGSAIGSVGPRRPADGGPVETEANGVGEQSDGGAPTGLLTGLALAMAGVLIAVYMRFVRPALEQVKQRSSAKANEPPQPAGGKGAMTVTLRPRKERFQDQT
jgi:hypothetical protein